MQQSRRELLDEVLDFVGHLNDDGARDTAKRILNRVLQRLWMKHAWRVFLHPTPYLLSTIASTRAYGLPAHFGSISGNDGTIRNVTTGTEIFPITKEELETRYPTSGTPLETTGPPSLYALTGIQPVHTQPASTGEALEVISTSALDVNVRVVVGGINNLDQATRIEVTLTGLAAVAVGTWKEIHEFGKAYPEGVEPVVDFASSDGAVLLRKVVGGVELQILLSQESGRPIETIVFYPTPDQVYSIAIPFIRGVQKHFHDADTIPAAWSPAIFEEMEIEWQIQAGTITRAQAAAMPRPAFIDLISRENASTAQAMRARAPYSN